MRVIAGSARGRELKAPSGKETTRPMMDIVKGSLFNMLESLGGVAGMVVLDLFAGSGSLGIEALSRGAARAEFVEQSREACNVIRENLKRLGFEAQAQVFTRGVEQFVGAMRAAGAPYELVFMDPPYPAKVSLKLLERLASWPCLVDNALICVGHHKREELPEQVHTLMRLKHRCFGASCISIYVSERSDE